MKYRKKGRGNFDGINKIKMILKGRRFFLQPIPLILLILSKKSVIPSKRNFVG